MFCKGWTHLNILLISRSTIFVFLHTNIQIWVCHSHSSWASGNFTKSICYYCLQQGTEKSYRRINKIVVCCTFELVSQTYNDQTPASLLPASPPASIVTTVMLFWALLSGSSEFPLSWSCWCEKRNTTQKEKVRALSKGSPSVMEIWKGGSLHLADLREPAWCSG